MLVTQIITRLTYSNVTNPYPPLRHRLLLLLLIVCSCAPAQTVFQQQSFESTPPPAPVAVLPFTTNVALFNDGEDIFDIVDTLDGIGPDDGTMFFGGQDVDNPRTAAENGLGILTFDAGQICQFTSARFVWRYNAQGFESVDDLSYELVIDGVAAGPVEFFAGGTGGVSTSGWQTASVAIPGTATTAVLRLIIDQNGPDQVGFDNVRLTATGTGGSCNAVCGVDPLDRADLTLLCSTFTSDDDTDALTAELDYGGNEPSTTVSIDNGATVGGDSPATVADGTIALAGLTEGQTYTVTISGGDCTGAAERSLTFTVPADFCNPSALVINEVLADPFPSVDANGDGTVDGADDEFVELLNTDSDDLDVSGFTVEEGSGVFYTFPANSIIPAGGLFTIFASGPVSRPECGGAADVAPGFTGIGLNNTGDVVVVRDAQGAVVAQMSYGPEGGNDESLALSPDGNLGGGYVGSTTIAGAPASPCATNASPALPVDLTHFGATDRGKTVEIAWATAREENSSHFIVERAGAGGAFVAVGQLASGPGEYRLVDEAPLGGTSYYRLRQVDRDGAQALYGPVSLVRAGAGGLVYPNPVRETLYLSTPPGPAGRAELLSASGQRLRSWSGTERELAVGDLPAGVYLLRLRTAAGVQLVRVVRE